MNKFIYKNPNAKFAKELNIIWDFGVIDRKDIVTDRCKTQKACSDYCKCFGINGGCPPISPTFETLYPELDKLFVFYVGIEKPDMSYLLSNMKYYTFSKLTDKILSCMLARIGNGLEPNTKFLWAGACRICQGGSKCYAGTGGSQCKHPEKRHYSLESTGVIVSSLTEKLFGFPLQWRDPKAIPDRLICIGGIFCKENLYSEKLQAQIKKEENRNVCS